MQQRSTSRRLALVAMLAFATVSFSTLAGWMLPPAALIPSNAPEPMPLLLLGLVLIAVGLLLRGSEHQVRAAAIVCGRQKNASHASERFVGSEKPNSLICESSR